MQSFGEKVQIAYDDHMGRHLIAAIDIEPGETLLEETPLLVAPHWDCEQMKCANCYQDSFLMCKKCQIFPLCLDCTTHDAFDCAFFSTSTPDGAGGAISKHLLVKNYPICALLKLLLLAENDATRASCEALFSGAPLPATDSCETEIWAEREHYIVAALLSSGLMQCLRHAGPVDAQRLHQLCMQLDAHSFEVTGRDGDSLKGVYAWGAALPHSCVPNTVIAVGDDFHMKIYAAVAIRSGAIIYNSYANPLMGTSQRQHQLRMARHIECACARCRDPSELDTHMSSMKCGQCTAGYAVCALGGSTATGDWRCMACDAPMLASEVQELLTTIGEQMVSAEGELELYERLVAQYAPRLHPNHFLLVDMKQNIATILRAMCMHRMVAPSRDLFERRLQLCEEVLPLVRAVLPGISKLYAIALYEYLRPMREFAHIQFKAGELSREAYTTKLEHAKDIASEAMDLLGYEPPNSPEGRLVKRIAVEKKRVEQELLHND